MDDPVAGWPVKRRSVAEAFESLERAGYHVGSAYGREGPGQEQFRVSRSPVEGADLLGLGVASFGHSNGVHVHNLDT